MRQTTPPVKKPHKHSVLLTEEAVGDLPLTPKPVIYWDTIEKGLAVTKQATSTTFYAFLYVSGKTERMKVGNHPGMTVDKARLETRKMKALIDAGINPADERRNGRLQRSGRPAVMRRAETALLFNAAAGKPIEIGQYLPDGRIFAGVSPVNSLPILVAGADTPRDMYVSEAQTYGRKNKINGHLNAFVGTVEDMQEVFLNRRRGALKDTFKESGVYKTSSTHQEPGYTKVHGIDMSFGEKGEKTLSNPYVAGHIRPMWYGSPDLLK